MRAALPGLRGGRCFLPARRPSTGEDPHPTQRLPRDRQSTRRLRGGTGYRRGVRGPASASRLLFFTGGGAPPPPRAFADASPRIHSPRLGMAAGAFPPAAGYPRRALSLMPRLRFTVLGSAWPQAPFHQRRLPPPRAFADASPWIHSPRLGMAAGAFSTVLGAHLIARLR